MKIILATILLISSASIPLFAKEEKQALIFEVPANWKVESKGDKGLQFYTVTRKEGDTAVLMLSRSLLPGNVNQISEQIESLARGFAAGAKDNKHLKLKTDKYKIEEFAGNEFSGRFFQFETEGGITQAIFMIGDAEGIWNGQFTGTKERWAEALSILKNLKKNG